MKYSQFQVETREALLAALSNPAVLELREVEGKSEDYLEGTAGSVKIWIYDDGAEVRREDAEHRFEDEDYASASELREAFVRRTVSAIEGGVGQAPRNGV